MTRNTRSPDDLKRAWVEVQYEYSMLEQTATLLHAGNLDDTTVQNAVLESFLLHARALIDFFYPTRPRPDDIIAADFFSSADEWESLRAPPDPELEETRTRAHKRLAHLSFERLNATPETREWDVAAIFGKLEAAYEAFKQHASAAIGSSGSGNR